MSCFVCVLFFFFKQKTAYEMRISDWSSDVCSSDLKVLIVAPMSGHFATLLRGTVERMLPGQDVYITDWRDAKLVPAEEGHFDLDAIGRASCRERVCQYV